MFRCRHVSSILVLVSLLAITLVLATENVRAQSSYRVRTTVFGSAGSPASSGGKRSNGTLGQPTAIGTSRGGDNVLYAGFWKSGWLTIITGDETPRAAGNELFQNYPNPFNPTTTIQYSVAEAGRVELTIYNVSGQRICTLIDDDILAGKYSEVWDGRNDRGRSVASGIYFYRLRAGSYSAVKKMMLLR